MIDIDNFKRHNDRFRHPEGDRCLRLVAEAIRDQVRGTINIGASVIQPSRGGTSDALLQRSDGALYDAKRRGRNRVHCVADDVQGMTGNTTCEG